MWEHMLEHPAQVATHSRSLAELQAHLFTLVPPAALPAQRDRLTCKIHGASARVDPSLVADLELLPPTTPSRLCHGDLSRQPRRRQMRSATGLAPFFSSLTTRGFEPARRHWWISQATAIKRDQTSSA
jgi:hypothetical protein